MLPSFDIFSTLKSRSLFLLTFLKHFAKPIFFSHAPLFTKDVWFCVSLLKLTGDVLSHQEKRTLQFQTVSRGSQQIPLNRKLIFQQVNLPFLTSRISCYASVFPIIII